jgi:hypothetical protein
MNSNNNLYFKYLRFWGSLSLLTLIFTVSLKSQIATDYEVATWYQFKSAAITYTFDDNTGKQLTTALPLFDKYNFKATFYVVTNWGPNWSGFKKASENGHEVGCHTLSHPRLDTMKIENQEKQLKNSQNIINSNITNTKCVTISYPYCNVGNMDLLKKYFISGRICSGAIEPSSPKDMYNISSIACGSEGSIKTALNFNDKVASAIKSKGWCVFLIHGIDGDGGYSSLDSKELGTHLEFMNTNYSDYWIGTFANVSKYIQERKAVSLTETKITDDSLQVVVNDNLNDTIYNIPITAKRLLPNNWKSENVKVYTGNQLVSTAIVESDSKKYIVFDAIPDKESVFLVNSVKEETKIDPVKKKHKN